MKIKELIEHLEKYPQDGEFEVGILGKTARYSASRIDLHCVKLKQAETVPTAELIASCDRNGWKIFEPADFPEVHSAQTNGLNE